MYTETELREALQHSAARADLPLAAGAAQPNLLSPAVELRIPPAPQRSWLPGVAAAGLAAVAVIAVAGGSFLLVARPAHRQVAAPLVSASVLPPSRTAVAITNLVTVPGAGMYLLEASSESMALSGGIQLIARPADRFDPAKQLTDPHPVTVAGTHGYAGKALIDLIDPHADDAGKAGAPRNTVAWQASNHSWLVVQSAMADGDLPVPTLIHDAGQLGVQARPAPVRSAYRAGWLPTGLTLTEADVTPGQPTGTLTLTAGAKSLDLQLTTAPFTPIGQPFASKRVGGYTMTVDARGYDQAIVQRVLDNLDLSRLHSAPSTWWTFDQALNH